MYTFYIEWCHGQYVTANAQRLIAGSWASSHTTNVFDDLSYMLTQVAVEGIKLAEMELQLEVGNTSLSQICKMSVYFCCLESERWPWGSSGRVDICPAGNQGLEKAVTC